MRLSEAIRLGAMLRPQARGALFRLGGSCVWGAAAEATGFGYREKWGLEAREHLIAHFPWAWGPYGVVIPELRKAAQQNDNGQTREQIADWIATVEPAEVLQISPVEEDACAGSLR